MLLDAEQQAVVDSEDSMMVIAGPGSGKTRVLTEKARKVFNSGQNLLCLTFTRSAAREMQERVSGIPAATIHSFCCGLVGWKEEWKYQGLLWRTMMMKDRPRFDWVLVDEVQDCNPEEMDVAISLVGDKIFAVGDPYQSIYGFQGALGPEVVTFLQRLGCRKVDLHNNYRSCPEIVEYLNRIYDRQLVSRNIRDTGLTAILCRTNEDVFLVSRYLKEKEIRHNLRLSVEHSESKEKVVLGPSNLWVMTSHQSKGLEFDSVYLYNWYPDIDQEEELRVYYVTVARASKEFREVFELKEFGELLNG